MIKQYFSATSWLKLLLTIGFIVIVFLMAISLYITLNSAQAIKQHSQVVHNRQIPQTVNLLKLEQHLTLSLSRLSAFLITFQASDETKFSQSLIKVEKSLERSLTNSLDASEKFVPLLKQIKDYKIKAKHVIAINKDREKNYIGISLAAKQLNPLYRQLGGILEQLITDELNKNEHLNISFLSALINTRNSWYHFIMSLRVYFSTRGKQDFQQVQFYLEQNQKDVQSLSSFKQQLEFESLFINDLESVYAEYLERLPEVLSLYKNEQWRHDIYMLQGEIYPLMAEVHRQIREIVGASENLTNQHIAGMNVEINEQVNFSKWIFVVSLLSALAIVLVVIKNVSKIAQSLASSQQEAAQNLIKAQQKACQLELAGKEIQESLERLKETQEQLLESKKMAALGGLVAGVAHEINTPLGICITSSSFLETGLAEIKELYDKQKMTENDFNEFIQNASQSSTLISSNLGRSAELVRSFKQIAVDQTSDDFRCFDVQTYLHEILLSLRPEIKKHGIELKISCPENIELNSCPSAFSQILTNLVANSITHGFEHRDKNSIMVQVQQFKENGLGYLKLLYRDNGAGMSKEMRTKVFEPFYTTKRSHGGCGIGMSLVYNLVTQRLNGNVYLESELDKGVQFIIVVPLNLQQ